MKLKKDAFFFRDFLKIKAYTSKSKQCDFIHIINFHLFAV